MTPNILRECPKLFASLTNDYVAWLGQLGELNELMNKMIKNATFPRLATMIEERAALDMGDALAKYQESMMCEISKDTMGELIQEGSLRGIITPNPSIEQCMDGLHNVEFGLLHDGRQALYDEVLHRNIGAMDMGEVHGGLNYIIKVLNKRDFTKKLIYSALRDALLPIATELANVIGGDLVVWNTDRSGTLADAVGDTTPFKDAWECLSLLDKAGFDLGDSADEVGEDAYFAVYMLLA
jgi:hypothetical protein